MSIGHEEQRIFVGLGEVHVADDPEVILMCLGLGSCVAVCAYDPSAKVGGVGHMVLPLWGESFIKEPSPRFVDSGIPLLVEEMERLGAARSRLIVKVVGGARMFAATAGRAGLFDIGKRNVEAANATLESLGLRLSAADTGGNCGRTVQLHLDSGRLLVSTAGTEDREL